MQNQLDTQTKVITYTGGPTYLSKNNHQLLFKINAKVTINPDKTGTIELTEAPQDQQQSSK